MTRARATISTLRRLRGIPRAVFLSALALTAGAALVMTGLALRAPADPVCTDYWIAGSGLWSTAANWSTHAVPATSDVACVTQNTGSSPAATSDTYTVTLNSNAPVSALVVGSGNGTGTQTVNVQGISALPATLTMAGSSLIRNNGVVSLDSTDTVQPGVLAGAGPLVNNGTLSSIVDGAATRRIEVPLTNNATVDLAAPTVQDTVTATVNGAAGVWKTEATGSFKVTAGSFDDQGAITNGGSFSASNMAFTQDGIGNTGNAVVLNPNVVLTDSTGAGGFVAQSNNTLAGTVPSGQTITVQGLFAIPATLTMNTAVTNNGTIVLDSKDTVQPAVLAGTGTLTNAGALNTIQDTGAYRAIELNFVNAAAGTVDMAAADTRQDHPTTTINNGAWTVEATGGFKATAGSFDNKGSITNTGAFGASNASFTQEGTGNSGNAILFSANVAFADAAGGGSFRTNSNNTLSGSIPTGQTLTVQGIASIPSTLSINSAVTNNGTIVLDSKDTVQPSVLAGTGTLTNAGALNTIQDTGAYRAIEVNVVNAGTGTVDMAAADTRQDHAISITNSGTWTVETGGGFKDSAGPFDNKGTIANNGSFGASNVTFTQEGAGNSGNAILFSANVVFVDSSGAGSFRTNSNNSISGTVPGGQTVTVQGVPAIPSNLTLPASFTNFGTIALDSTDSVQAAVLTGVGPFVNNGTLSSIVDGAAVRRIEVPLINNGTVDLAAPTVQDHVTATVNSATGSWKTEPTGSFTLSAGTFDDQGTIANNGSFSASNVTFTQEGTGNTGNAIVLKPNVLLNDSAGAGGFVAQSNNTLSGTVPAGQTITVQGLTAIPATLTMNGAVTNNGTIVLDSKDTVQPAVLAGTGTLTNAGALNTIQDAGAYRAIEVNLVNSAAGTVDMAAADTRQDHVTSTTNNGTWTVEPGGTYKDSAGTWTQSTTGTLALSVNATGTPTVTGLTGIDAVSLDGTLAVTTTGSPTVGQQFTIISTGPVSGKFAHYQFGSQPYTVVYNPNSVVLTVPVPLVVTTTTLPDGRIGVAYPANTTLTSSGGSGKITWAVTTGALPDGLALDGTTGIISGTPLADAVTQQFTVTATDSGVPPQAVPATLSINILPPLPTVTTTSLPAGQVGVAYPANTALAATGGATPYTWSVTTGALPAGLALDPSSGAISGAPTAGAVGTTTFTVTVTDSEQPAQTGTKNLSITVTPPGLAVATASLPPGQVGVAYPANTALAANGGIPPYSWAVTTGAVPAGLTLAPTTGAITGTPTLAAIGTASFSVTVTDSQAPAPQTATANLSITIAANPVAVTTSSLPSGQVGVAYPATTLAASGGVHPYSWAVTTGALPAGLALDPITGAITGTPTAAAVGTASLTVTVTDSLAPTPQTATANLSITIAANPVVVTTSSLPSGQVGAAYPSGVALAASGGVSPYSWAVTTGALPAGLVLDPSTGAITGTPTAGAVGTASFTVTATDSLAPTPQTGTANLSIVVSPPTLGIVTTTLPSGQVGIAYPAGVALAATGGTPPYTWAVTTGALPAGVALDPSTGAITGAPTAAGAGTASFTVTATDSQAPTPQTAAANLSITVTGAAPAATVTGVSPATGLPFGGTDVTITGSGFTGATAVSFGATAATNLFVVNDSTITATAPAGTNYQTVDVTVNAPGGVSPVSSADKYSYTDWTVAPLPPAQGVSLSQVSCISPTQCTASGRLVNASNPYFFNGVSWTVIPGFSGTGSSLPTTTSALFSVSCLSATDCTAVGYTAPAPSGTPTQTLVEHFNGTAWSVVTGVNFGVKTELTGVSCLSPTFCLAVGESLTSTFHTPIAERFNGTAWSQVAFQSLASLDDSLSAVSCVSASNCTAVGSSQVPTATSVIEHFNGTNFSAVASPASVTALTSVSCTSATNCTANDPQLLGDSALRFDGTSWTVVPNLPLGIMGVACVSATDCTGAGYTPGQGTGPTSPPELAHFNGTAWTLLPAPSPDAIDAFGAIDCRTSTFCVAVGAGSTAPSDQPLIEVRTALNLTSAIAFPTPGQSDVLTATSPIDVATLASTLAVVDTATGKVVGSCATGTTCPVAVTLSGTTIHTYVAEIRKGAAVTALSSPLAINTTAFSLTLTAPTTAASPGQSVTLTATATSDVAAAGSPLRIVDNTTGKTLASCASGLTCSASVLVPAGGQHTFQAVIKGKANVQSAPVSITWQAMTLSLAASPATPAPGQAVTLTATANFNPATVGTPVKITDIGAGRTLLSCSLTVCTVKVDHFDGVTDSYQASIAGKIQLTTAPVSVTWPAVTVTLHASTTTPAAKATVTLTATAGAPLDGTGETLVIVDTTTGGTVASAVAGTTATASVKFPSGSHTYQAEVKTSAPATIQISSAPVTVTW